MNKLVRQTFNSVETKAADDGSRALVVKISTASPDRSNDIVKPEGVILDNFLKNPVVAAFHRYDRPPIGKALEVQKVDNGLIAKVEFTPEGVNPEADMIYELNKGGFMNAWSIGFIPKKWSERGQNWSDGREFQEWELLEFSAVLVPDNTEALTLLRSKGFNPDEILKEQEEAEKEEEKPQEGEESENKPAEEEPVETKQEEIVNQEEEKSVTEITIKIADTEEVVKTLKEASDLIEKLQNENAQLKEGRVLSEKNKSLINNAITQLNEAANALQAIIDANEPKSTEVEDSKDLDLDWLVGLRDSLRKEDKDKGIMLRDINEYLKNKKSQKEGGE
jgi:uncharacterized protein